MTKRRTHTAENKTNIYKTDQINFWLEKGNINTGSGDWVIFFGDDFNNTNDNNREEYIKKTNLCLDYIREKCSGYKLFYKPHPAETNEQMSLNLTNFKVIKNQTVSEVFLWENAKNIKYTFSVYSTSSITAYYLGFNSYVFYKLFASPNHSGVSWDFRKTYFKDLPDSFFITNLSMRFAENRLALTGDKVLKDYFTQTLLTNKGGVWFIVMETRLLVSIISIVNLLKTIDPDKKINLVVVRHHRWDTVDLSKIKKHFDNIVVLPRIFYSLKPVKLLEATKTARSVKNFKISSGDIIIGFSHADFVENCFISFHQKNFKIAFLPRIFEDIYFKTKYSDFLDKDGLKFTKASFFYNRVLEPLLGLRRTIFKQYGDGKILNIFRFQKSVNEIYNSVFFF